MVAALTLIGMAGSARAVETDVLMRDPSTIVKVGDTYWVYGTGKGVRQYSSTDRVHWTYRGAALTSTPAWVTTSTGNTNGDAWAPDIHYFSHKWHLYYSYSSIGTNKSGIGVATNDKGLDPTAWVDQGPVVLSTGTDYNALDPCIFEDRRHHVWLSFGSYFSGIKLMQIDAKTGKPAGSAPIYTIAEHPQAPGNSVEASAVYFHKGYYYLFVNWDNCLAGDASNYNIRVGRSKSVTGPYVDEDGVDMVKGGGSLFLGSVTNKHDGQPYDDEVGPGHAGILHDKDGDWLSCHYEWAKDRDGKTTVNVLPLTWDVDGWPRTSR